MRFLTRRSFFVHIAAATAGASFLPQIEVTRATTPTREPHIDFPETPRDRIAIASWPFRAYIDSPTNQDRNRALPGMDLKDFASHVSSKFNVRNIEPYNWHFAFTERPYLETFLAALTEVNARAVNIAVDGKESFYDPDPATRTKAVDFAKKWIDVALEINAPSVRVHNARLPGGQPDLRNTVDSLRRVADYGGQKNIVVNLENDDPVSEDPFFLVNVIERVNHPFLRALPDFANSMQGGDADFNYRAVEAMFRHAYCICHVKDAETPENARPFTVDLPKTFRILKASGYRGFCSIEFDGQGDPHAPTARLVEAAIRNLA